MNETEQQLLQKIADHIGTTAQQAWTILIHMYRIDGIVDMACGLLFASIFAILAVFLGDLSAKMKTEDEYSDWGFLKVASIFVWLLAAIVFVCILDANALEIIAPQGYALMQLLQKIK